MDLFFITSFDISLICTGKKYAREIYNLLRMIFFRLKHCECFRAFSIVWECIQNKIVHCEWEQAQGIVEEQSIKQLFHFLTWTGSRSIWKSSPIECLLFIYTKIYLPPCLKYWISHNAEASDECETAGMMFSCGQTNVPEYVTSAVSFSKLKPATVNNLVVKKHTCLPNNVHANYFQMNISLLFFYN
jgi:hypothetical protein